MIESSGFSMVSNDIKSLYLYDNRNLSGLCVIFVFMVDEFGFLIVMLFLYGLDSGFLLDMICLLSEVFVCVCCCFLRVVSFRDSVIKNMVI